MSMYVSSNSRLLVWRVMVGRNNHTIAYAFEVMVQALQGQQNQVGDEFCGLGKF